MWLWWQVPHPKLLPLLLHLLNADEANPAIAAPLPPETFTLGVTDVMFNATNAVFGRLLKTADGHVVTLAYWKQQESVSHDQIPYYENKG